LRADRIDQIDQMKATGGDAMETVAFGYGLIEGPRVDPDGNLFFSDVPNGGVYRLAPDGSVSVAVPKRRGVGGIALHAAGGLVLSGRNLCHVKDGQTRILFGPPEIPGFNDIFTDSRGRLYAGSIRTDPFNPGEPIPGELWRIELDGTATELYTGVGLSNGIGFSPDERLLYHSDSSAHHIILHDVSPDGAIGNRRVFAEVDGGVPDGLAVNAEGGVWVAVYGGGCAVRFTPDGTLDQRIAVPARAVTSLCFGGADLRDLFIVSADNTEDPDRKGTIFRTRVDVPGVPVPLVRV
jgi:gluconolactonase